MRRGNFKLFIGLVMSILFVVHSFAAPVKIIKIKVRHDIRVVYDIDQNNMFAGVGRGLFMVRGLLESYKNLGVPRNQLHIVVVVHGSAVYWTLNNKTYEKYTQNIFTPNPNEHLIKQLIAHGVSVDACNVSLREHGWSAKDVMPGVKVVFDAYTRLIDLQMRGYAYIKLP